MSDLISHPVWYLQNFLNPQLLTQTDNLRFLRFLRQNLTLVSTKNLFEQIITRTLRLWPKRNEVVIRNQPAHSAWRTRSGGHFPRLFVRIRCRIVPGCLILVLQIDRFGDPRIFPPVDFTHRPPPSAGVLTLLTGDGAID